LLSKSRNFPPYGLYGGYSNGVPSIHFFQAKHIIQFRSCPTRFLGFSNHEKEAPRQEILKWLTVHSTFSKSGWSIVRSASLAKGGTLKRRLLPHLHKVPTQSNKVKVSPRTLQTVLVSINTDMRTTSSNWFLKQAISTYISFWRLDVGWEVASGGWCEIIDPITRFNSTHDSAE
jgi:hypothetical protein